MASTWQVDSLYGSEDLCDGVHPRGEDAVWWARPHSWSRGHSTSLQWWSAGSKTRSQDLIDQVKLGSFVKCIEIIDIKSGLATLVAGRAKLLIPRNEFFYKLILENITLYAWWIVCTWESQVEIKQAESERVKYFKGCPTFTMDHWEQNRHG